MLWVDGIILVMVVAATKLEFWNFDCLNEVDDSDYDVLIIKIFYIAA